MMFGEDTIAIQLKPDVYEKLAAKAAEKGFKSPEAYISELLKGFLIITLLGLVAWQAFAPSENQFARKFGIRRRSDSCTVLDLGDADPFEG